MKVFAAQLNPTIGDLEGNQEKVVSALERAKKAGAEAVLFPELTLSGYPPEDLLLDKSFIEAVEKKLETIAPLTKGLFVALGLPRSNPSGKEKSLYNSAAIFADGELVGFKDKTLLPTYDVFDERRFFEPGKEEPIWEYKGKRIAVTICEDLWQYARVLKDVDYLFDPVLLLKEKKCDLIFNLSSSPYFYGKKKRRLAVMAAAAQAIGTPLVLCNQAGANDQLIFDGHSAYFSGQGELLQLAPGFVESDFLVDLEAKKELLMAPEDQIEDLYAALVLGVRDYFSKQRLQKALLGLSGGIDSALVACIAVDALGASNVLGLSLPMRFSSPRSFSDAAALAKNLGIELKRIEADAIFQTYLDALSPFFGERQMGVVEENLQARVRGMLLMAFSNREGAILLNTGNKSEFAMGYTTLYGDLCGGLGVLLDVTKMRIYQLARFINAKKEVIPSSILERAPSAELRENQTDQDTLPPYEILDPILEDYLEERLSLEEIAQKRGAALAFVREIVHHIHFAEYKRRQAPIGIRVTPKCFSKGRNVPIVQRWH